MNRKPDQLAAAIDQALRELLSRGLQDPRVGGLVTITTVRITADLSEAIVGVSVFPEEKGVLTLHGLESAGPHLRRQVSNMIQTRTIPPLRFRLDRALKLQASLLHDLDRARADLEMRGKSRPDSSAPSAPTQQEPPA